MVKGIDNAPRGFIALDNPAAPIDDLHRETPRSQVVIPIVASANPLSHPKINSLEYACRQTF